MNQSNNQRRGFFKRRKKTVVQPKHNYAFIDSQNLNLGIQRAGWKMNWKKFRVFLGENYDVEKAFMFIGYMPENEDLYAQMQEAGYLVALKPTLDMFATADDKDKVPTKGNVDTELVMYVMKEISNYNKAIIISGDGDFYSLIEYLKNKGKLLHVMVPNWRYSTLLKPFEDQIVRLDTLKKELAYRAKRKKQRSTNRKKSIPAKTRGKTTNKNS